MIIRGFPAARQAACRNLHADGNICIRAAVCNRYTFHPKAVMNRIHKSNDRIIQTLASTGAIAYLFNIHTDSGIDIICAPKHILAPFSLFCPMLIFLFNGAVYTGKDLFVQLFQRFLLV